MIRGKVFYGRIPLDRICRTPGANLGQKDTTMNNQQLEITLQATACRRPGNYRQRRVSRARWWFGQMRRVVDQAIDWAPAPAARPEQSDLRLARGR